MQTTTLIGKPVGNDRSGNLLSSRRRQVSFNGLSLKFTWLGTLFSEHLGTCFENNFRFGQDQALLRSCTC